jgi:outer membrane receptor protein involved in Fe transport
MRKACWLLSTALWAAAAPGFGQDVAAPGPAAPSATERAAAVAPADDRLTDAGDIVVTATRRSEALSDVPLAVSAVTGASLANSGASDIRQLNQLSPSLLVSSSSSEAGGGVARIRGIGTVGDNPGLESSVAVFVDGVYRSRSATALTELGTIDRIEVLRGPQGTLFGRNASAGLISVITARPSFEESGTAELTYGNYNFWRGVVGLTGPIAGDKAAYRIDGIYTKRDGFLREADGYAGSTGRRFQDRDRWLVRGQLLFEPSEAFSFRLIGDYADRDEQCCTGPYIATDLVVPAAGGGVTRTTNPVVGAIRSLGGLVEVDPYARRVAITPGRDYRQDVRDWGLSGEATYDLGSATLTSITAYRDNDYKRGQDSDFSNLDILYRPSDGSDFIRFRTFSQELRLQGEAFDDRLDWLVGGYYANERLDVRARLTYGADFDRYLTALVRTSSPAFPGFGALQQVVAGSLIAGGAPAADALAVAANVSAPILPAANTGEDDRYRQRSRNYAFFTHNVFDITNTLSATIGVRYTNETKRLRADLRSNTPNNAGAFATNITNLLRFAAANATTNPLRAALANAAATSLRGTGTGNSVGLAASPGALYSVLSPYNGVLNSRRKEDEWTGTAVLSWKPVDSVLTYASYSKGYKAGGFNLERSVLNLAAPSADQLQFEPEKVDAYELGAKWNGRGIDINVAAFWQEFRNFQLNNFQGLNFIVENINGCGSLAGGSGADSDVGVGGSAADAAAGASGACTGKTKPGVRSRGVEIEAFARPLTDLSVNAGFTLADTRYKDDLVGKFGQPLPTSLFQLPGRRLSNAPQFVVTGSAAWTPAIGGSGLRGLVYADARYQSGINTGSDLNLEKTQDSVTVVNARIGLRGANDEWSLEFWAQNLFDVNYTQVGFNTPLQGGGETRAVQTLQQPNATRLYSAFLAEPRTFGVTARTKF